MTTEFSYLHEKIKEYPERFIISPTSIVAIEEFEKIHPDVPNDYTDFLRQFGAMTICEGAFCVYGGAIGVQEIFDVDDQELEGILLIGDNCAGDFLAAR